MVYPSWVRRVSAKSLLVCSASSCLRTSPSSRSEGSLPVLAPASIASIKGLRNYMEDEFFEGQTESFKLVAVYDGHGGQDVSKYLKKHLYKALLESFDNGNDSSKDEVQVALKKALAVVDRDILERKQMHRQGSTCCMIYLEKSVTLEGSGSVARSVISANVGDSRAVLARGSKALDLTKDHKPEDPAERQRVESLGGVVSRRAGGVFRVNHVLAMSRAMGDGYLRPWVSSEPDLALVPVTAEDDFVVVASDGLWDVMSSQECVTMIQEIMTDHSIEPKEVAGFSAADRSAFAALHKKKLRAVRGQMASFLAAEALRRGSTDNITILIQWLKDDLT